MGVFDKMVEYYVSGGNGGGGSWTYTTASTTWNDSYNIVKEVSGLRIGGGGIATRYYGKCKWCLEDYEPGKHTEHGEYCKHCFGPRE